MGDGRESLIPCANFNTPVKDLVYKDLMASTFTQADHDRVFTTWSVRVYEAYDMRAFACVKLCLLISERTVG